MKKQQALGENKCHQHNMSAMTLWVVLFVCHLVLMRSTPGYSAVAIFTPSPVNLSNIHSHKHVLVEENHSILSCGRKCKHDNGCLGFGFHDKLDSNCVIFTNSSTQPQGFLSLDGYVFYTEESKGKCLMGLILE